MELGGGPIGTLDVYAVALCGWDQTEVSALQAYAGAGGDPAWDSAKAQSSGRLAAWPSSSRSRRTLGA